MMPMKVCFVVTLCLVEASTFTVHNKAALIGFVYKMIKDVDWFSCIIIICQEDLSCISYNFCVVENRYNIGTCSLNNCSLDEPRFNEAILVWVPGCTFHQLEQNQVWESLNHQATEVMLPSFYNFFFAYRGSTHIFNSVGRLNVNSDATILEISINILWTALGRNWA